MGSIYEIICWTTGRRYVGQTIKTLKKRLIEHKSHFKTKPEKYCSSFLVLEHGNYEIYELEKVEDESELNERENYFIQHTECVNVMDGTFDRKENWKIYFEVNRETILERQKKYREDNQEKLKEKWKNDNEKKKVKYTCICNSILTIGKKSRHEKTEKHLNFLKNNCTNKDEKEINISNGTESIWNSPGSL